MGGTWPKPTKTGKYANNVTGDPHRWRRGPRRRRGRPGAGRGPGRSLANNVAIHCSLRHSIAHFVRIILCNMRDNGCPLRCLQRCVLRCLLRLRPPVVDDGILETLGVGTVLTCVPPESPLGRTGEGVGAGEEVRGHRRGEPRSNRRRHPRGSWRAGEGGLCGCGGVGKRGSGPEATGGCIRPHVVYG